MMVFRFFFLGLLFIACAGEPIAEPVSDTDRDGILNDEDADDDNDGVLDQDDADPTDSRVCADADQDGICDAGDADADNDGVENDLDASLLDAYRCRDADADDCDDCSVTGPDLSGGSTQNDGTDTDSDGICDGPGFHLTAVPMSGQVGSDWVMRNYYDLDPAEDALLDYRNFADEWAKTYDGHEGIDFSVATFRDMDAGFTVLAAAPGEVTSVEDQYGDRNTSFIPGCNSVANYVTLLHQDGWRTQYVHIRQGSAAVQVGQQVAAGDVLGVIGSAGCSTWPHLHLTVFSPQGERVDPFLENLWIDPPLYDVPLRYMDVIVKDEAIDSIDTLRDPGANANSVAIGETLGLGLILSGGYQDDAVRVELRRHDDSLFDTLTYTLSRHGTRTSLYWNRTLTGAPGTWTAIVMLNDVSVHVESLLVE